MSVDNAASISTGFDMLPNEVYYVWYFTVRPHMGQVIPIILGVLFATACLLAAKGVAMIFLIFADGTLRSVSMDATDASNQMHQLMKDEGYNSVRVIRVNGGIHDEVYREDREES